ncbi:hypothetical protein D1AOALGA4SA_4486 [Olavius algarvensis Delta 1 endosymbiont]|nr:hypothetical protein D1AOALGA4SA_4486 [Olavius algarvensis Delta 1 endosymbiont]
MPLTISQFRIPTSDFVTPYTLNHFLANAEYRKPNTGPYTLHLLPSTLYLTPYTIDLFLGSGLTI